MHLRFVRLQTTSDIYLTTLDDLARFQVRYYVGWRLYHTGGQIGTWEGVGMFCVCVCLLCRHIKALVVL